MQTPLGERVALGSFLFVLLFAPVAFGAVEPWSLAVLEAGCVIAIAIIAWTRGTKGEYWRDVPGLLPLLLLLGVMAFQLIPLPQAVLSVLSPKSYQVYSETLGVISEDFWAPVTLDRRSTLFELMRYLSYAGFYVAGIQLMSRKGFMKFAVQFVVLAAAAVAFISLIHRFSASGMIMWVREAPLGSTFFGPYVNKNHYAAYMAMVFPLAAGLFIAYRPDVQGSGPVAALRAAVGYKRIHKHFIYGFALLLIAASVFVSLSRGGVVALCVSMVLMAVLLSRVSLGRNFAMGTLFLLIALLVGWFGWDSIFERFGDVVSDEGTLEFNRIYIWKDTIGIIRDFTLTGAGFGSFGSVYPSYRSLPGGLVVDHAHNDYLELLVEGGLVSFVLAAWFVSTVVYRSIRTVWDRREQYSITMGIAGISAMAAMLVSATVHFNAHIGANALYFFFMSAFAVSASHTRLRKGFKKRTLLKKRSPMYASQLGYVVAVLCFLIVVVNLAALAGKPVSVREGGYSRAKLLDPLNAGYKIASAREAIASGGTGIDDHMKAVALLPADARMLQAAAVALDRGGDRAGADSLMQASLRYGANNYDKYFGYSSWLLSAGWFEQAEEVAKQGISQSPARTVEYIRMLESHGLSGPEVLASVPALAGPHVLLAGYFLESGDELLAEDTYWIALDLMREGMREGGAMRRIEYIALFKYFFSKQRLDAALAIAVDAVETYPDSPGFRLRLGAVYESAEKYEQARREYEKELEISPGNRHVTSRLKRLSGLGR